MAVNVIKRTWLQDRMVRPETLNGMAFQAEAGAHRFEITGYDSNGNVMAFSGTVTAIFLRPDNTDVPLTGVISNGVAQVTLSQECYQVPGRFGLAIFVNSGNTKTVVYKCIGPVGMTSSGVEASSVVQSVSTLIDRIEAAVNSIPQDYSALSKSVSATCPEMRDGSTGNPWNTDSITTKYVIKIDKSCNELILEYIGSTQAQYYVFGYSVFNGVADGTESYAARTSAASFLDYPEKYVQTEPYVIIPVSQLGDYTHIAIVLWAKSDETTFIPLRIATEQNNLRVTFRHASYMGHEEINNRSVKVGVQNASKMASPLKLIHFSDLHRDVNALNRIRASAKYVCPNADNIICTGDMVANTYAEITSWWVPEIMTCIGNHDTASYDGTYDWTALTMAQRDEMYISPFKSYWGIVHTAGTSYYYKDYTAAHIRLIVMDAMLYSGTPGAEATAQTQWLANLLASAITGSLHVIIAIHAPHGGSVPVECSFTKLGQDTMPVNVDCNTPDVVINTVATAIGNGLHFIGYICGHTHQDAVWDCTGDRSQLMYTVTCAAVDQTAQWANSDQYRSEELDAFNVLTIDTASTTIKILRGGGANTDVALRPRVSMVINYSTGKIITDTYASGTQDAVVYGEAQELTDAQKAQARANIGAGSAADVSENKADITANTNEITNLKSAIENVDNFIGNAYTWMNGYWALGNGAWTAQTGNVTYHSTDKIVGMIPDLTDFFNGDYMSGDSFFPVWFGSTYIGYLMDGVWKHPNGSAYANPPVYDTYAIVLHNVADYENFRLRNLALVSELNAVDAVADKADACSSLLVNTKNVTNMADQNVQTANMYFYAVTKKVYLKEYTPPEYSSGTVYVYLQKLNNAGSYDTVKLKQLIPGETFYVDMIVDTDYAIILVFNTESPIKQFFASENNDDTFAVVQGWNAHTKKPVPTSIQYYIPGNYVVYDPITNYLLPYIDNGNPCNWKGTECSLFDNPLCIGDSITQGAPTPPDITPDSSKATRTVVNQTMYSYPASMKKQWGVECTNWGRSGISSQGWYDYYSVNEPSWSGHDAAIMLIGNNDYHLVDDLGGLNSETLPTAITRSKAAMMSIITKLKADNADIKIFICTLLPQWDIGNSLSPYVCDNIRDIASTEENVYLIDLSKYSIIKGSSAWMHGHPTALGYNQLAREIGGAIGYTIVNNPDDFKWVQFIGTEYAMDGQ